MGLACGLGTVRSVLRINHSILLTQYVQYQWEALNHGVGLRLGNYQAIVTDKLYMLTHGVGLRLGNCQASVTLNIYVYSLHIHGSGIFSFSFARTWDRTWTRRGSKTACGWVAVMPVLRIIH